MNKQSNTGSTSVSKVRSPRILGLSLVLFALSSCEDPITDVIEESVRVASLPDRTLLIQAPSDGSISPVAGTYVLKDGEAFAISATANGGFAFLFWEQIAGEGEVAFDDYTAATTNVRVSGGDATIKARIDDTNYTISIAAQAGGSVSPGSINLEKGIESLDALVATPSAGYAFAGWSVTAGLSSGISFNPDANSASVTITASSGDATVRANFSDIEAPTGTVAIQNEVLVDATYWSKTRPVTVNLTSSDNSGSAAYVKLSESTFATGTSTGWTAMALSKTFTFASDGSKTLYVRFRDAGGNESELYTDTTVVDSTPPVPTKYLVEYISNGSSPLYVYEYSSSYLQLTYLAGDAGGSGVEKVYFSNTTTRPPVAQVATYTATPDPYPWSISSEHTYQNVYFWFADKLGNISSMYTRPVRYDDKYELTSGNNSIDATSNATIIIDDAQGIPWGERTFSVSYSSFGNSYLVDPDYYKWGFNPLEESYTYPVEIELWVNNGGSTYAAVPPVTFYDNEGETVAYTYSYNSTSRVATYYLNMPYYDTGTGHYYFYMSIHKDGETAPYALRPNYYFYWTFTEDQGM